ncbi:hypothetical protein RB213_013573 [Colletotrichum asianum]
MLGEGKLHPGSPSHSFTVIGWWDDPSAPPPVIVWGASTFLKCLVSIFSFLTTQRAAKFWGSSLCCLTQVTYSESYLILLSIR